MWLSNNPANVRRFIVIASVTLALAFVIPLTGLAHAQAPETRVFRAGAAASNVTPPLGSSLSGSMRDRTADHVRDELHARCLVLDDGATRIALVLVDNCLIPRHVFDTAKGLVEKETGIPADHIPVSYTHLRAHET